MNTGATCAAATVIFLLIIQLPEKMWYQDTFQAAEKNAIHPEECENTRLLALSLIA